MIHRYLLISIFLFCYASGLTQDRGLTFVEDFNQAKELAEKEDKYIFVDVYADWCQPCKQMDKEVFTDLEVVDYFSKRFVSTKLDGDRRGASFVRKHRVSGFPTLLFFDAGGKEMHRIEGYADTQRLLNAASMSLKNPKKRSRRFKEDYRRFKENPSYLEDYVVFCEETEDYELADKLCDQYVKHIDKIDSVRWMDFVMGHVYKEKSKLFELLKDNQVAFKNLYGKGEIDRAFLDIIVNTEMWKMDPPSTEKLLSRSKKKFKNHKIDISDDQLYPAIASRAFDKELQFKIDDARTDLALLIFKKYSDVIDKKYLPAMLANVALQKDDKGSLNMAKDHMEVLLQSQPSMSLHDINSIILYKLGHKQESFKQVALAQKFAVETNQPYESSLRIMKESGLIK